jgi:electron transfer flavoprotein beta subunit
MKVLVFIKRVPDTAAVIKPSQDGKDINRSDIPFIINPYDEFAIEEAIRLKESKGAETVVLSVGDEDVKENLRRALAMGIDRAILVKHPSYWNLNPAQIGYIVSEVARREKADIIFTGKLTIDDYTYAIAPYIAEALGYSLVTYATKIEYLNGKVRVERETDLGSEVWEADLPVVISAERGLNEPRLPNMKGIMMAKKKEIEEIEMGIPNFNYSIETFTPPPPRKGVKFLNSIDEIIKVLKEEVKIL